MPSLTEVNFPTFLEIKLTVCHAQRKKLGQDNIYRKKGNVRFSAPVGVNNRNHRRSVQEEWRSKKNLQLCSNGWDASKDLLHDVRPMI